jgi:hypothetical protein
LDPQEFEAADFIVRVGRIGLRVGARDYALHRPVACRAEVAEQRATALIGISVLGIPPEFVE